MPDEVRDLPGLAGRSSHMNASNAEPTVLVTGGTGFIA